MCASFVASRCRKARKCLDYHGLSGPCPKPPLPKFVVPGDRCGHNRLHFQSGGYYVACGECGVRWVAIKGNTDVDLDFARGSDCPEGERVR